MKNLFNIISFFLIGTGLFAQTPISGIINSYAEVTAINLTSNSVTLGSSTGFSSGDKVLLIQMQGATIDASQSSAFGTITMYNDCGNYEFQDICQVQGNTIIFNHKILHNYTVSGAIQLVKVPVYQSATITNSNLTAQAWNGTTGGILVLEAETLDFGAQNIDVTGLGFRGGAAQTSGAGCNFLGDFSYYTSISSPDEKALKGEGIAKAITNRECGRGPQANGGGGGNNHNGGGSGGANYGTGGEGGQRIKQSTFLCGSEIGIQSKSLSFGYGNSRIFLGGGGGAGHGNNGGTTGESGLDGGGIVILNAQTIIGNNQNILANGIQSTVNANGDGAGGGGAGGTVLITSNSISSTLNMEANGSNGINTNNGGSSNCSGPGGGAGGGVVWVSSATNPTNLNTSFTGGTAGIIATTSQSNCTVGSTNGGQSGTNGTQLFNLTLSTGSEIFASSTLTETTCDSFTSPSGNYTWTTSGTYFDTILNTNCDSIFVINLTINSPNTEVAIADNVLASAVSGAVYQWIDCENFTPIPGATNRTYTVTTSGFYALQITKNGCTDTSDCIQVTLVGIIENSFNTGISVYPNPAKEYVNVNLGNEIEGVTATVFNITGSEIFSKEFVRVQKFKLELPQESGIYILKLETNSGKIAIIKISNLEQE